MRTNLIELRGKRNQADVAKDIGISQQYLSHIEKGIKTPSIKIMKKFEEYYEKDMQYLFPDIFLKNNTTLSGIE